MNITNANDSIEVYQMERSAFLEYYWNNYMLHEKRFIALTDYVDICVQNAQTCSDEIITQYLSVCSSLETALKLLADIKGLEAASFLAYMEVLQSCASFSFDQPIELLRGKGMNYVVPFEDYNPNKAPAWWSNHNKVKHNRVESYELGTFIILLQALSALYFVNMILAKTLGDQWQRRKDEGVLEECLEDSCIDVPNDVSKLFRLVGWETRHTVLGFNEYAATDEDIANLFKG